MRVFIVHAHPEPRSFNGAMTRTAMDALQADGHEVEVSDLYAMQFNPVSDRRNFLQHKDPHIFKQQQEEIHAAERHGFAAEIAVEMDKLRWCDLLILQFPLWWFGLPGILKALKRALPTRVIFLEASDEALQRRFSETRRPHPLGRNASVKAAIGSERKRLRPIRELADMVVDTTNFNVHELRAHITQRFQQEPTDKHILISCVSFGYKHGVPEEADLVFDVRFLPNPHFIPKFRPFTGKHPQVAKYIRSFPQTQEFINRISDLLLYLLPHYIKEGKSYLTIAFGCTGGQHRSVMIAEEVAKRLRKSRYHVKVVHRDCPR